MLIQRLKGVAVRERRDAGHGEKTVGERRPTWVTVPTQHKRKPAMLWMVVRELEVVATRALRPKIIARRSRSRAPSCETARAASVAAARQGAVLSQTSGMVIEEERLRKARTHEAGGGNPGLLEAGCRSGGSLTCHPCGDLRSAECPICPAHNDLRLPWQASQAGLQFAKPARILSARLTRYAASGQEAPWVWRSCQVRDLEPCNNICPRSRTHGCAGSNHHFGVTDLVFLSQPFFVENDWAFLGQTGIMFVYAYRLKQTTGLCLGRAEVLRE